MTKILTPWQCASEISDWMKEQLKKSGTELLYELLDIETGAIKIYPGFLPYAMERKAKQALCPAVVVRPVMIRDQETESTLSMAIFVTTYDDDMINGCHGLYELMETIREILLTNNPINMRWEIKNGTMESTIPDEQPYPMWWGRIDFDVNVQQPREVSDFILGGPKRFGND